MRHVASAIPSVGTGVPIPIPRDRRWSYAIGAALFAALTCAGARLTVPIPGSPVPGTLQTLSVLSAGLFLGGTAGAFSQVLYLALGLAGLPVFALAGAGPAYLIGPTGGYLLGYMFAPIIVARFSRPGTGLASRLAGLVAATLVIHLLGCAWLAALTGADPAAAFRLGSLPFLAFDAAKVLAALSAYAAWRSLWTRRATGSRPGSNA